MNVVWGIVVLVSSLLAWAGQIVSWLAPSLAARLGLAELRSDVDRTFWLDARGEAVWDSFVLWTMPVAGVLLVADHDWWRYAALVGGGSYLYFAGRGIVVRLRMRRGGVEIGGESAVRTAIAALATWGAISLVTVVSAIVSLEAT